MHCRNGTCFALSSDQPWLLPSSFVHGQQIQALCFSSVRETQQQEVEDELLEEAERKKVMARRKESKMQLKLKRKNLNAMAILSTMKSAVITESQGRRRRRDVKVIGLGTRASNALYFCRESSLLSSAELWVSTSDAIDNQLLCLQRKDTTHSLEGQQFDEASSVVICVIGVGANSCIEEVLGILQSSRVQGGLSVMIIIQPFKFEGLRRKKELEVLAGMLFEHTDLCLVFEHDALVRREKVKLTDALKIADNTILYAIKAISDLCTLSDQIKVFHAPPEGLRDITTAEILSMLVQTGKARVGFGSSYSIKSAVQRAAFESPFLQGLVPGVKGLVVCTISCAEEKGKNDLQAAIHALRCIIGPQAQLVCTTMVEPSLKQGVVLVTILFTRIDNGGIQDKLTLSSVTESIADYPHSMNGRELRISSAIVKEQAQSTSSATDAPALPDDDGASELSNADNYSDAIYNDDHMTEHGSNSSIREGSVGNPYTKDHIGGFSTVDIASIEPTHGIPSMDSSIELDQKFFCGSPQNHDGSNVGSTREIVSGLVDVEEDKDEVNGRISSSPNGSILGVDKNENRAWRFFTLPTILDQGKKIMAGERQGFSVWEPGPNSADAEAWAQTRQKLGNLGDFDRNSSFQIPVGIKTTNEYKGELSSNVNDQGRQRGSTNQAIFDFAAPLVGKVITSGLEAVMEIYNAASAKAFKREENEESKLVSSSLLSQRAASMLESERSSVELPPMVEMKYKNGIYKGRCKGGLPEGKGRLSYADGSFYDGVWKQGKRMGIGSFYYTNGDVFQGNWRDDQMHGKGWFYFHTGERLYADFWKGKANGEGRYYSAKGDVFFGRFRDGWRHGKSVSIEGGVRWCETWEDGVLVFRTEDVDQN